MRFENNLRIEKKRKIIRQYIKNNPSCTYRDIKKNTKIKVERIYTNMADAYKDGNVKLSKNLTKRNKEQQKRDVVDFIKNNPLCSVTEIQNSTKVNIIRIFGSIINAYTAAGIPYPLKAVTSGVMDPSVIKRCNKFEKTIFCLLENLGKVKTKVRISGGIIDCIFTCKNKDYVVEIKDFRGKNNITMSEIKQLIRYMRSLKQNEGLIICPKKSFPKRKNSRNIYIDNLHIQIISQEDLWGHSINL